MRILFEDQTYSPQMMEELGLEQFAYTSRDGNEAVLPYVGYVYSSRINDSIFILPKVFLFQGSGIIDEKQAKCEIAFGKYEISAISEVSKEHNPLKEDGYDKLLFGLSTWIYRAIDKYSSRHPKSVIIKRSFIQGVTSHSGLNDQTLLDTVLSLINFHKEHSNLFTYITIINSSGNNKIHWGKTICKVQPILQNGSPFYAEYRNKNKAVNYDEELIVLFYSVLQYLRQHYFFPVRANLNYDLFRPAEIDAMIESGRGTRRLRSIRRKYFKDELVLLWKLLFAFFDKSEAIRSGKSREEALLARSFDRIFEEMVDGLIGDDYFSDLKENEDGKEIDHIYKENSLLDESKIYYIGDSKYYYYGADLDKKSLYKQFTYAKNIIQLNIDIFNKPSGKRNDVERDIIRDIRYRDSLTEGYNLTPNFFVRGYVSERDLAEGSACYSEDRLCPDDQIMPDNSHFENRPFDRDTLILKAYNINFLFVLASYVTNVNNENTKTRIRKKFRKDMLEVFNSKYDFFRVTPISEDIPNFVNKHFEEYIGKMYHSEGADFVWFAFDHGTMTQDALSRALRGEASVRESTLI